MYLITGLGRSGTSFVAQILKECGISMGEYYNPEVNAGYEHHDVTKINKKILNGDFWGTEDEVAEIRRLAMQTSVVKDPRFALTLGLWLRYQAKIDGVFLCLRDLTGVFESSERTNAGTMAIFNGFPEESKTTLANAVLEGFLKLCKERGIEVHRIRYPESIDDFIEVACLSKVVPDQGLLRSAWEQSRRRPGKRPSVSLQSNAAFGREGAALAQKQEGPASPRPSLGLHMFRSAEDHAASISAGLGQTETARRAVEEAHTTKRDAFTVRGFCWTCGSETEFRVDYRSAKEQSGPKKINWRERLACPRCGLNNRKRATLHLFHDLLAPQPDSKIYVAEQLSPLYRWLTARYVNTTGSEYLGEDVPLGVQSERGIRNEDLTRLTFRDGAFDYVLALDVFEHIPDLQSAIRECRRVLKDNGSLFFTAPFDRHAPKNTIRAVLDDKGGVRHLLPPDYHGNPLDPKGSLSFYTFGWELLDQVREAGFDDVQAYLYWSEEFGYLGGNQVVFVATAGIRNAAEQKTVRTEVGAVTNAPTAKENVPVVESPVFVVGCPRSGTTVLARALGEHSQLWVSAESDFIQYMMNTVSSAYTFGTDRKRIWLSTENVKREEFFTHIGYGINALFTSRSTGKRWIDHSNSTTYCLEEFGMMFPQAKFLHIIRDGRDTVNSMIHFKPTQPWAADFQTACNNWKLFVTMGLAFERKHPDRVLRVSYESLIAGSAREFSRILSFLDLPYEQKVADYLDSKRINSSFSNVDREKLKWQNSWQQEQHDAFLNLCGNLMASLGHGDEPAGEEAILHHQAVERADKGDVAGAAGLLEECVKRFPGRAVIHNDLGVLYSRLGDSERARQQYRAAVDLDPQNTTFLKNFADFLFVVQGNAAEALDLYERASGLAPEDKEVLFAMGNIFITLQRHREAREYLERYLHLDPFNLDAKLALGALLQQGGGQDGPAESRPVVACSIVIPVFNKADYTKKCIAALKNNTPQGLYEVIIVDNASTDETKEYLKSLAGDTFTVITNAENVGFTLACNQGARTAHGEYVLFLNNDTEPQPKWLEALVETIEADPRCGIAGSKLVYPDGRLQEAGGIVFRDGSGWNYGRSGSPDDPRYAYVREVDYVSGASLMIRHDLLKRLNYFDEQYSPGYYEDTDLCFGARSLGYSVLYCPFSTVIHHEGVSSGTDLSQGMKRHQVVNREKFTRKWTAELEKQLLPGRENVAAASERGVTGNILVIDPFLPMFDRASGSLRLFTIVKLLRQQGYHVTYIARNGQGQEQYEVVLKKIGVEVYATDPDVLRQMGYTVNAREINLKNILASRRYDYAILSFYNIALQYLFAVRLLSPATRVLVDTVDIHFIREMREAELHGDCMARERAQTTKEHELFIYSKADAVITVTERDWEHIKDHLSGKPHFVIPNIHIVDSVPPAADGRSGLLFVGNFNHPPNSDAVKYFITDIFPLVKKELPHITLTIVGNNPPEDILALQDKHFTVTGYVPLTEPYLKKARVSIAPLRYGAGMKGKVGEAMANGLPVVTTSVGAEGMGLVSGETAFIADAPEEFAQHVILLCADDVTWRNVSEAGKQFIKRNYSPEKVDEQLSRMLADMVGRVPLELTEEDKKTLPVSQVTTKEGVTSIVILTFNQLKFTKECMESIKKQTPEPHEIIIVDNGSTDGTVKWLKKLVKENSNCRLIENRKNLGFSTGCNQGIAAATGEYILLLNNDVLVTEHWLSGMLECLNSAADIGIVGPMTNTISGPQKVEHVGYSSVNQLAAYAKAFRESNRHRRVPLRRIVGFCMLFRRSLIDKTGLLDESFGSGNFEDDDYCLRATLLGYRNIVAGDVFLHHYGSRSFIGNRMNYGSSLSGNRRIFTEKWSGIDPQSLLGKRLLVVNALETARELHHRGQDDKAAAALLEGIKHDPEERGIYYLLAEILIDGKQFKDALEVLTALPSDDSDAKKLVLIGYCKEGLERYDEADGYAERALSLDASSAAALNLKGILAYKRGDGGTAEDFFRKSIEADPSYGEPHTNLGVLEWAAGRHGEAVGRLERGAVLSPAVIDIATIYHTAVTASGMVVRAEKTFREAQALYPLNRRIAFLLIDLLIKQKKNVLAMQEIEKSMMLFGIDDGILAAALDIRQGVGPQEIDKSSQNKAALSLCMIVKNEEQHLAKCLMSVKPVVDEMIVVDTGSNDRTKDIAAAFGAKVFGVPWTGDFAEARNFSLSKASGDWILVLDADEVISPLDYAKLSTITATRVSRPNAYSFVTRNYIVPMQTTGWTANDGTYAQEEAGTGWFPSVKVRLFPRDGRIRFVNPVHELVEPSLARIGIPIKDCDIPVHHYGKLDSNKDIAKGEKYYCLGKKKLEETGENVDALRELAIQAGGLKKFDEAIDLWQRALKLRPDMELAYINLASVYLQMDKFSEALAASRKARELKPDLKEAVCNNALCEMYAGDAKHAVAALKKLLDNEPEYPSARIMLAVAYLFTEKRDKGIAQFHKLRITSSGLAEAVYPFAKKLVTAGRSEYAMMLLDVAVENHAVNDDIAVLRAECERRSAATVSSVSP